MLNLRRSVMLESAPRRSTPWSSGLVVFDDTQMKRGGLKAINFEYLVRNGGTEFH